MTLRKATNNINKIILQATPEEIYSGSRWYDDARTTCEDLSERYGMPLYNVVYTMAALSPNVRWSQNIAALTTLLRARKLHGPDFGGQIVAGYPANVAKAKKILNGDLFALRGRKVISFASNILHLESNVHITIDVHAYSIARGQRFTASSMPKISPKTYDVISSAYRAVAERYKITAPQCQAITWTVWRRLIKEAGRGNKVRVF